MLMKNPLVQKQQQQQQFLWRPAGEVLHFLTENSTKPTLPQAPFLPNGDVNSAPVIVSEPLGTVAATSRNGLATVRQAPTVWKPPSAMKAFIPPISSPVTDFSPEGNSEAEGGNRDEMQEGLAAGGRNSEQNSRVCFPEEQSASLLLMPPPPDKNKDSDTAWHSGANPQELFNCDGNSFSHQQVHCQEYSSLKQQQQQQQHQQQQHQHQQHQHQQKQQQEQEQPQHQQQQQQQLQEQLQQQLQQENPFLIEDNNMVGFPKPSLFSPAQLQMPIKTGNAAPQNIPALSKGLSFGSELSKQSTGMVSPFAKQQVAQTALFSGLGTVSFTTDISFPAPQQPASIFAQSPGFGAPKMSTSSSGQQQQQQQGTEFKSNSASEKGSSNSQAGDQAGFRRSELQGKSLLSGEDHSPATKITSSSKGSDAPKVAATTTTTTTTTTRKLRTRPIEVLMSAINKSSDSKPAAEQTTPARAAKTAPKSKPPADLPPVAPRRKKQQQHLDVKTKRGAYFAHTGAWIAQKKSTRRAKNKFKQREAENVVIYSGAGTRSGGKKRSLAAMSNEKPQQQQPQKRMNLGESKKVDRKMESKVQPQPEKRSSRLDKVHQEKALRSEKRIDKVQQQEKRGGAAAAPDKEKRLDKLNHDKKQLDRKLDKVRSIHETMRVVASTPEDQQVDDEDEEEGEASEGEDRAGGGKPLIRSKRGRSQALPTRLRDTVMNKVKKRSRK